MQAMNEVEHKNKLKGSFRAQLAAVFLIAAAAFLVMRSSDFLAVDGALRAVEVYQKHKPFLHPNNHLLYPFNLYVWSTLLSMLGIRAAGPARFFNIAQAMNAFAAAGCLTVIYGIARKLTGRTLVASAVAGGYGLSHAFLLHATNTAEPMVGVLWSLLAMALGLYGIWYQRRWALAGAGLLLALALATYQVMILLGVPILFLLYYCPTYQQGRPPLRARLFSAGCVAAGFGVGVPLIYGTAYYLSGARSLAAIAARFFGVGVPGIKLGFNLLTVPAGFALALFPCLPYKCGFRCLAIPQYRAWIPVAAAAVLIVAGWLLAMLLLTRKIWQSISELQRVAIGACAVGLIATLIPSLIWIPAYDKFWLQPLACFFLGSGIVCHAWWSLNWRTGHTRSLAIGAGVVLAVLILPNLAVTWSSLKPKPYLAEAQELAALAGPRDLIVGDWSGAFFYYQALWAERASCFNVPTQALWNGAAAITQMQSAVEKTQSAGGKVFFLGILDLSENDWKIYYLGEALNAPYGAFAEYRRCAQTVKSFPGEGRRITLRQFVSCDGGTSATLRKGF
jgi:hypothetical protein